jgi:hypothetical protein
LLSGLRRFFPIGRREVNLICPSFFVSQLNRIAVEAEIAFSALGIKQLSAVGPLGGSAFFNADEISA